MNAFYEKMINESPFIPNLPTGANGIRGFYQFQAGNGNTSQEHLNSSQNEMSWLNSSFGEKNWLNSSLNLPPEQRYQSLNDMVSKITDDHESMNLLSLSLKGKNLHLPFNNAKNFNFNDSMNFKEFERLFLNESQNRKLFDLNKSLNASNGTKYQPNSKHMAPHNVPFSSQTSVQSNNSSNSDSLQSFTNVAFEQPKVFGNGIDVVNGNHMNPQAINPYFNLNGFNQMNNMNYMQLAYLPSYSHHLATLTPDQRNYLIEQQTLLFMTIAQAERTMQSQMVNQMNQHVMPNVPRTNSFINTLPNPSIESQFLPNKTNAPLSQQIPMPTYDKNPMFNPNFPLANRVPNVEQSFHYFQQPQHIYPQQQSEFKMTEMDSLKANYIPAVTEPHVRFDMFSGNKQFRQHRRTGPSNELHVRLEECLHQLSCLETERKKIETEFSYLNFVKHNTKQIFNAIPRLPSNPSRVDRMIVEYLKEHQRILSLTAKFDHLKSTFFYSNIQSTVHNWLKGINQVQNARREELMNSAARQQQQQQQPPQFNGQAVHRSIDEKDVINLAHAINQLSILTGKTRTSLWCIFQISHIISKPISIPSDAQVNRQHMQFDFANLNNIKQFLNKTLAIKSDLIEKN